MEVQLVNILNLLLSDAIKLLADLVETPLKWAVVYGHGLDAVFV